VTHVSATLELAAIFGGSFTLALSGALMPGPLLTVTVAESARMGFRAGPLLITGHALLELLLFLKSPSVMGIIALVGGGMLLWMGVDMVRNSSGLSLSGQERGTQWKTHTPSGACWHPREHIKPLLDPLVGYHRSGVSRGCHEVRG